jgi:cytochrome b involved in lipid metabolism
MEYTLEELSKHNTTESLWMCVDNNIYDVTEFVEKHPGGKKPILNYSGTDASAKFQSIYKHLESPVIDDLMKTMLIGTLKQ